MRILVLGATGNVGREVSALAAGSDHEVRAVARTRPGREAFGDVPLSVIHPGDIAAVAVDALTGDRHAGQAYRLSGPATLSTAERVHQVGVAAGRELSFVPLADDEARTGMLATTPPEYVDAFFQFYRDGLIDETTVQPTFEQVMGRPPRAFATWAEENAGSFRRG